MWALVLSVVLAGCSGQVAPLPVQSTGVQVMRQVVTVVMSSQIASSLRQAGFTSGIRLPAGWVVGAYGATGDDRWLGVSVTDAEHRWGRTASVAIDTSQHVAYVHQQVNAGWYSVDAIAVNGWLVHQEKQQLNDSQCVDQAPEDCFVWRLYAQRAAGGGQPRLLASSVKPGSQAASPIPVLAGGRLVWSQAWGDGYEVRSWLPGAASVQELRHLARYGNVVIDGDRAVIVQRQSSTSVDWAASAADASGTILGVFSGRATIGLLGDRLLYLPVVGDQDQTWRIGTLRNTAAATASATAPINLRSFDVLRAEFLDSRTAYAQTETSLSVIDASTGDLLARIPTAASFSIARTAERKLTIVQQQASQPPVILIRP